MTALLQQLDERLRDAIGAALGAEFTSEDPVVRRSSQRFHGDYQANGAFALAKRLGLPTREVAEKIVAHASLADLCSSVEVAGAGFVNLWIRDDVLASAAAERLSDERLGVPETDHAERIVIDYSHPNVAKEMHVGHLRSTIIGDALARLFTFKGHEVVRQNHLGDWGTPFGMLIEYLLDLGVDAGAKRLSVGELTEFYQEANARFESDASFAERARRRVVLLQGGDEATFDLWRLLFDVSKEYFNKVYDLLDVLLTDDDIAPESMYNDALGPVTDELQQAGVARIDQGAVCVFPPGFTGKSGRPVPLILRKSDGGYTYETTDLAALRHRARELRADKVIYVVDARQRQRLAMVLATAREMGWLGEGTEAEHVAFGMLLGQDGKPLRTRSGTNVKLIELLDEAIQRAALAVREKNPTLDSAEQARVARAVGIGAVKYADLSNDLIKDYVFDLDRMLSFDGNTGPYLQYAHARVQSIFRKAGEVEPSTAIELVEPAERELALQFLGLDEAIDQAVDSRQPHKLCTYLFDLASLFTTFYETCPVLNAPTPELRASRLALCRLTGRTLALGLDLLGIEAPDRL